MIVIVMNGVILNVKIATLIVESGSLLLNLFSINQDYLIHYDIFKTLLAF